MLDIFELRNAKYLKFYLENNYIYCENIKTDEKVIVGGYMKMNENRYLFNYIYIDQDGNANFRTEFIWSKKLTENVMYEWIAKSKKEIEETLKKEVTIAVLSVIKLDDVR